MLFIVLLLSVVTTFFNYLTFFLLFLWKYSILKCQISGCEWEKYEPSIGINILSWGKSGGQKSDLVKHL